MSSSTLNSNGPLASRTAYEREVKALAGKYKRLHSLRAAGLNLRYTKEELDEWEEKELALLKARCTFGDLAAEVVTPTIDPVTAAPEDLVVPPMNHLCVLRDFQVTARRKLLTHILHYKQTGVMLQAGVGTGKTFIVGSIFSALLQAGWKVPSINREIAMHAPIVWVTKPSIVTKTQRDLKAAFGLTEEDCLVTSYDQLRSNFGRWFFREKTIIKDGEPEIIFEMIMSQRPYAIVWDEAHCLKNTGSLQSRLGQGINDLHPSDRPIQLFMSATIGTRLSDFKCISVGAGYCENAEWDDWISVLATEGDPTIRSKAAMKRYMDTIDANVVRVPAITGKYKVHNRVRPIKFLCEEDREHAEAALERYKAKKQTLKEELPGQQFMQLVAFNEFRRETEPLRAPITAQLMHDAVQAGYSAISASSFKVTLMRAIKHLIANYGVKRSEISVIWGGDDLDGAPLLTKEQINEALHNIIKGIHVPNRIIKQIHRQAYPATDLSKEFSGFDFGDLQFGKQSQADRQRNIDRFQTGQTRYNFFTFASGGVGLSLHDSDDHFNLLLKGQYQLHHTDPDGRNHWLHKRTGQIHRSYPRRTFSSPTFSGQDFVQGLGRGHRSIFSLSDTYQDVLFFEDSIEVNVMEIVSQNLRCLTEAVRSQESWQSAILERKSPGESNGIDLNYTAEDSSVLERDEDGVEDEDAGEEVD